MPANGEDGTDDVDIPRELLPPLHCLLYCDTALNRQVRAMQAANVHLIQYDLAFKEFSEKDDPFELMKVNRSRNYKTETWYRVFSKHGRSILKMAFNYDVLSLKLLKIGVKDLKIPLVDGPPRCFQGLSESDQIAAVATILLRDFMDRKPFKSEDNWNENEDLVCHQVIQRKDKVARFRFECCTRSTTTGMATCQLLKDDDDEDHLMLVIYALLAALKIFFFLISPWIFQKLFFEGSTETTSYVVPIIGTELKKTMLVKKVCVDDDPRSSGSGKRKLMRQFMIFRKLVKAIPSDEVVPVSFNRLDILVDQKELMSEKEVPVGVLRFLYDTFVRCEFFARVEPFQSCCAESIFGSWSPRFLWMRLRKRCDCNRGCKECCSWMTIFKTLGTLLLMAVLPIPYYIRVVCFYLFEADEMEDRKNATDLLNLDYTYDHNLLQWMTPTHPCLIGVYITYLVSFLVVSALRVCDNSKIDGIIQGCVTDMRRLNRVECLRMLFAHVLLPFEKFGIFGIPIALIYWPFAFPLCLLVCLVYIVPMLYVTGRLLVHEKPTCLGQLPSASPQTNSNSISKGTTSIASCFLLDSISPDTRIYPPADEATQNAGRKKKRRFTFDRQKLIVGCGTLLVGLLMVLWVYTLMLMYAEGFGYLLEVCVMSVLGAVLNADQSIRYVVLGFWSVLYLALCYRSVYVKYAAFTRQMFAGLKTKLGDCIQEVSSLRQDRKKNTAFKYYSADEIRDIRNRETAAMLAAATDESAPIVSQRNPMSNGLLKNKPMSAKRPEVSTDDSIEYIDNRLHWKVNSLALFVDKDDVSRIPRDLYWQICKLDFPGSPGPLHRSILTATGRLLGVLLYLVFFFVVIFSVGNIYEISSTNQMFIMLVSGCLPLVQSTSSFEPSASRTASTTIRSSEKSVVRSCSTTGRGRFSISPSRKSAQRHRLERRSPLKGTSRDRGAST